VSILTSGQQKARVEKQRHSTIDLEIFHDISGIVVHVRFCAETELSRIEIAEGILDVQRAFRGSFRQWVAGDQVGDSVMTTSAGSSCAALDAQRPVPPSSSSRMVECKGKFDRPVSRGAIRMSSSLSTRRQEIKIKIGYSLEECLPRHCVFQIEKYRIN